MLSREDFLSKLESDAGVDWGDGNRISLPKGSIRRAILEVLGPSLAPEARVSYGLEAEKTLESIRLVLVLRHQLLELQAKWERDNRDDVLRVTTVQRLIPTASLRGSLEMTSSGAGLTPDKATLKLEAGEPPIAPFSRGAVNAIHLAKLMAAISAAIP